MLGNIFALKVFFPRFLPELLPLVNKFVPEFSFLSFWDIFSLTRKGPLSQGGNLVIFSVKRENFELLCPQFGMWTYFWLLQKTVVFLTQDIVL